MDEQSLEFVREGIQRTVSHRQMNSNRSSNQSQDKAKGKNRSNGQRKNKSAGPPPKKRGMRGGGDMGQESVFAPAAVGKRSAGTSRGPREILSPGGRTITFREYVQDINGSIAFAASQFPIQPGLSTLFAWLATQAVSYDEYELLKLSFGFETEKSSATSGKVMYAFQPDAADLIPANKQEMLENLTKGRSVAWAPFEMVCPTRTETLGRRRYIRSGALAANLDIKTYDFGNLIVATQGMADATAVGELYVEYTIRLMTPIISVAALARSTSLGVTGVSPAQASLFGTVPTVNRGLDATATINTITFNRVGQYLVDFLVTGTGLFTNFVPVVSASTAVVVLVGGVSNAAANVGTIAFGGATVNVTQRGQTAVFDCTTQSTTITASATRVGLFATAST